MVQQEISHDEIPLPHSSSAKGRVERVRQCPVRPCARSWQLDAHIMGKPHRLLLIPLAILPQIRFSLAGAGFTSGGDSTSPVEMGGPTVLRHSIKLAVAAIALTIGMQASSAYAAAASPGVIAAA